MIPINICGVKYFIIIYGITKVRLKTIRMESPKYYRSFLYIKIAIEQSQSKGLKRIKAGGISKISSIFKLIIY